MDSLWYFEDHGRAQGPISTRDLIKKLNKGELQLLDVVFKEGDDQWHPIEHFTEITNLMGSVTVRDQADWIVLRALEVDGKNKFEQIGPFNIEQVLELVDKGKINFSDYVWRTGFENWVPLGKVDQFDKPLPSSVEVDLSLYQMPRHQILDNPAVPPPPAAPVKVYNPIKKVLVKEEPPPEDAKGEDLAKPVWEKPIARIVEKAVVEKPKPISVSAPEVKPILIERTQTKTGLSSEPSVTFTHTQTKTQNLRPETKKENLLDAKIFEDEISEDVVSLPQAENVEKMKQRWQNVGLYVGGAFVVLGVCISGGWAYKYYFENESVREIVQEPPPGVFPPTVEDIPLDAYPPSSQPSRPEVKKEAPAKVAQPTAPPKPVVQAPVKPAPKPVEKEPGPSEDYGNMGAKQQAFYHHSERKFILYTSSKGISLANDLQSLYQKKGKNSAQWKSGFGAWQNSLRALLGGEMKNTRDRLYPDLYGKLKKALVALDGRSRDFNSQLVNGRGPTKELTVSDIIAELKRINAKARALDQ